MAKSNYIPDVKLKVTIVYPRTDILVAATDKFTEENKIDLHTDRDYYKQRLYHRKRSRTELLDNITFTISKDAFKQPAVTNDKLIGLLLQVLKCLDPNLKFDRELIEFICDDLGQNAMFCENLGIVSYYSGHQRKHLYQISEHANFSENIHLSIYYDYSQED